MKKLVLLLIAFVILSGIIVFKKIESKAFNKACQTNSISAYKSFYHKFPISFYKREVKYWIKTLQANTLDSYKNYLKEFPKGRFANIAIKKASSLEWEITKKEDRLESYEKFINEYPASLNIEKAKQELPRLRLQEAYREFAKLNDIDGAMWDSNLGWPIILSDTTKSDPSLPPMDMDDLIMIMKIIEGEENPGVSIEPCNTYQKVRYIPSEINNTHLGQRLFETDRTLKALSFGKDPITNETVTSSLSGFKTLVELEVNNENFRTGYYGRIWFKPKEVNLFEDGNSIIFDKIIMGVESESRYLAPKEFASFFEENYIEFAKELPIYKELIRIAKFVAIARWLKDRGYLNNLALSDYSIKPIDTPSKTPSIKEMVREMHSGTWTQQYFLIGGVILDTKNTYIKRDKTKEKEQSKDTGIKIAPKPYQRQDKIAKKPAKLKPCKTAISWNFKKYKAVAIPLKAIK
ncbi:MAG: hypothetical protein AB1630_01325 [bacterium]